ncbi:hypothetical protein SUGI_0993810 [Cryptomeria japonica]|nr:hypothetical protein SUGI_0993810 [Cryptomeria japonica]
MMNLRSNLVNHSTSIVTEVPCLSMRSKPNNRQKQRQRATAPIATQVLTTVEKEYKLKSGSPNDYPHLEHKEVITKRKSARKLSDVWREVQGSNNWEGLLEPMDHLLRSELIKYRELAQACYDAFDFDHYSKYCGSCKYNRRTMLHDLGLSASLRNLQHQSPQFLQKISGGGEIVEQPCQLDGVRGRG